MMWMKKHIAAITVACWLFCLTGLSVKFDPDSCPPGRPFENCTLNPCDVAEPCDTDENAVCRPDYCGGCVAKYYHSITDEEVHCEAVIGVICELKNVTVECHDGKVMNIVYANYGRLSTEVCRHPYDSDLLHNDTNCKAANSTDIVKDWCHGKTSCHPIAANEIFGDPCYGVYKYLFIDFTCEDSECLPAENYSTKGWPGPPTNLQVALHSVFPAEPLKISWQLPQNESYKYIKGFELHIIPLNPKKGAKECIYFHFVKATMNMTELQHKITFYYNCYSLSTSSLVSVLSVPRPAGSLQNPNVHQIVSLSHLNPQDQMTPLTWGTYVIVHNDSCHGNIHVHFDLAPKHFNFSVYQVLVKDRKDYTVNFLDIKLGTSIQHGGVTFHNVTPGWYRVLVRAKTRVEHSSICVCTDIYEDCTNCLSSQSYMFYMNDEQSSCYHPPVLQNVNDSRSCVCTEGLESCVNCTLPQFSLNGTSPYISVIHRSNGIPGRSRTIMICIGIICVLVTGTVGGYLLHKKFTSGKTNRSLIEQKVLIVYSNDSEVHKNVVQHLVELMEDSCSCQVWLSSQHSPNIRETMAWLMTCINEADIIIFINSEGACHRLKLIEFTTDASLSEVFLDQFDIVTGLLSAKLEDKGGTLSSKILMVRFPYTSNVPSVDWLKDCTIFNLPEALDIFIRYISRTPHFSLFTHSIRKNKISHLKIAIFQATEYHSAHINFFEEKLSQLKTGIYADSASKYNLQIDNNYIADNDSVHGDIVTCSGPGYCPNEISHQHPQNSEISSDSAYTSMGEVEALIHPTIPFLRFHPDDVSWHDAEGRSIYSQELYEHLENTDNNSTVQRLFTRSRCDPGVHPLQKKMKTPAYNDMWDRPPETVMEDDQSDFSV